MVLRDVIGEINNKFFENSGINLSLATFIDQAVKSFNEPSGASSNSYYSLTELTNPQQKFCKVTAPYVKRNNTLARKLIMGKILERKFANWCRLMPELQVEEGTLDGAYVGIPRVRGRVDFIIDNRIVELKTKENIPESVNEIYDKYPNDLEQLVFYSALHPSRPEKNILLFMKDKSPFSMRAFEVNTKDFNTIKSIILERIQILDNAFLPN